MLNKLFKKPDASADDPSVRGIGADASAADEAQQATKAEWEGRLGAAQGDDTALLAVAREAPIVDVKFAAVMALTGEDALKRAERELRNNDRRVHRAAKQRYESFVQRREAAEQAARLIESAAVLVHEANLSSQRLVELDRAWQALDAALLDETIIAGYSGLRTQLTALFRERADFQLAVSRWCADATQAATQLHTACLEVASAAAGEAAALAVAAAAAGARSVLSAMPAPKPSDARGTKRQDDVGVCAEALRFAIAQAVGIETRLALLAELSRPEPAAQPGSGNGGEVVPSQGGEANDLVKTAASPISRWQALPPIAEGEVAAALNARFEEWRHAHDQVRESSRAEVRSRTKEKSQAEKKEHIGALAKLVTDAETALAEGHLADAGKALTAIDKDLGRSAILRPLQARIDAVQAEFARLKGWQHWGGARARDDLVAEAEALARNCTDEKPAAKLQIKAHTDAIDKLRNRWKELDKLGGATSRTLWQRFDSALKAAYAPVIAHLAKMKMVRQENLAARNKLIAALNATPLEGADVPESNAVNAEIEQSTSEITNEIAIDTADKDGADETLNAGHRGNQALQDWRGLMRALEHFQTEWRKLGPLEHTVPHKARQALVLRMEKSVARLEQPLQEARRGAQLKREQLVARAKALAAQPTSAPPAPPPAHRGTTRNAARSENRNAAPGKRSGAVPHDRAQAPPADNRVAKVRELQIEWQSQAKEIPLARNVENVLWAEFKAATDAVFAQRDALKTQRDAEFKAGKDAREALITRFSALGADATAAAVKRLISEGDLEWQRAGPVAHGESAKLEARFRAARDAAQHHLAGSAQRSWQATCDVLSAKLAMCDEAESTPGADSEARWSVLPALPALWEKALQTRFKAAIGNPQKETPLPSAQDAIDTVLLQLESALDLPSPPAFLAGRRELKLRAMKNAIENRQVAGDANDGVEKLLAEALVVRCADAVSRERMAAILAAMRMAAPNVIK